MDSLEQEDMEPEVYIRENLEETLLESFESEGNEFSDEKIPRRVQIEDLIKTLLHLRRQRISENLDQLRSFQQDMQDDVTLDFESYQKMIIDCSLVRQKLDRGVKSTYSTGLKKVFGISLISCLEKLKKLNLQMI